MIQRLHRGRTACTGCEVHGTERMAEASAAPAMLQHSWCGHGKSGRPQLQVVAHGFRHTQVPRPFCRLAVALAATPANAWAASKQHKDRQHQSPQQGPTASSHPTCCLSQPSCAATSGRNVAVRRPPVAGSTNSMTRPAGVDTSTGHATVAQSATPGSNTNSPDCAYSEHWRYTRLRQQRHCPCAWLEPAHHECQPPSPPTQPQPQSRSAG